jgi:Xaa-Pro aminopeptidase
MLPQAEYVERVQRVSKRMGAEGFGLLLLTGETNIEYFSGFRHHAPWTLFARPFFQLIGADGRSVLLVHTFLEPEAKRTSAVRDVRHYAQSGGAPVNLLMDIVAELGTAGGRIGMELGYEQRLGISINDLRQLEIRPGVRLADCSDLLWSLRRIKSPAEIALLERSSDITAAAFEACFEAARPGMTEAELGRIAAETMVQLGAERPGFILMTSGAGNYGVLSGKPTQRKLQRGEMLWMDLGAVYGGYWSDFCRAAYFGAPSGELDKRQAIIREVNQAMTDAAHVGNTMRDVAAAGLAEFRKNGIDVELGQGRIGHGIGLMSTEPPHVALYDETPCEEGLVFTIEPRFVNADGVFNCEELLVVTANGPRVLTNAPREIRYIS